MRLNSILGQFIWPELLISISIYCDLHAHSRKYNVFMYGCENRKRSQKYLMEQVAALITAADKTAFYSSAISIDASQEREGPVQLRGLQVHDDAGQRGDRAHCLLEHGTTLL